LQESQGKEDLHSSGEERNWDRTDMNTGKNQFSPVITLHLFFLFACSILETGV
jgi:hypothetical protein